MNIIEEELDKFSLALTLLFVLLVIQNGDQGWLVTILVCYYEVSTTKERSSVVWRKETLLNLGGAFFCHIFLERFDSDSFYLQTKHFVSCFSLRGVFNVYILQASLQYYISASAVYMWLLKLWTDSLQFKTMVNLY